MSSMAVLSSCMKIILLAALVSARLPSVWHPDDAVSYYCQRWYHQSVVKNGTLYIQGGMQSYNIPNSKLGWTNSTLGYNPFLLQLDLKTSWDWKKDIHFTAIEQNGNTSGSEITLRTDGVMGTMFQGPINDPNVYVFGGTAYQGNDSFPSGTPKTFGTNDQFTLWGFDNSTKLSTPHDIGKPSMLMPSYGAAAEAPDQGLAFYLSGQTDKGTSSDNWETENYRKTLRGGMQVIDMVNHISRDISVSGKMNDQPRVGGGLEYVPGVGDRGVLISLGGMVYDGKESVTWEDSGRLLDFATVDVFDINAFVNDPEKNGTWYAQDTSGSIPPPRIDFCSFVVSAQDNSSHNIYIYGGHNPTAEGGILYYDDINILSLPSFRWVKVFSGKNPRFGHTCHLAGARTMITVGGHNSEVNECDWERKGVGVFDLPTLTWRSAYIANEQPYELDPTLVQALGGEPSGGAKRVKPERGWTDEGLESIMMKNRIYANRPVTEGLFSTNGAKTNSTPPTPSTSGGPASTNKGESNGSVDKKGGRPDNTRIIIIAISVVGIVLVASMSWVAYICLRRRRRSTRDPANTTAELGDKARAELFQDSLVHEVPGGESRHEVPGTPIRGEMGKVIGLSYAVEMPGDGSRRLAATELPATPLSLQAGSNRRVPILQVPSPERLRPGRAMEARLIPAPLVIPRAPEYATLDQSINRSSSVYEDDGAEPVPCPRPLEIKPKPPPKDKKGDEYQKAVHRQLPPRPAPTMQTQDQRRRRATKRSSEKSKSVYERMGWL